MPAITIEQPPNGATVSRYTVAAWGYVEPPLGGGISSIYRVRCELRQNGVAVAWADNCVRTLDGDRVLWQVNFGVMAAGDYDVKATRIIAETTAGSVQITIHAVERDPTYFFPPLRPLDPTYQNDPPVPFRNVVKNDDAAFYLSKGPPGY